MSTDLGKRRGLCLRGFSNDFPLHENQVNSKWIQLGQANITNRAAIGVGPLEVLCEVAAKSLQSRAPVASVFP